MHWADDRGGAVRRASPFLGAWATLATRALTLVALTSTAPALAQPAAGSGQALTNLDHLRFLTTEFEVEGETLLGVWIYAEPSPTDPDAYVVREAAGEGVTDLDDVARAVVAYLWHHRVTGDDESLSLARGLLGYVLAMQAEDGEFYNFVFADGSINRLGITSRKGAGFWAARALWALAEGMRDFAGVDPEFAATLRAAFLVGLPAFEAKIAPEYGEFHSRHGFEAPSWLPDDGADVASILLLGLSIFLQLEEHEDVRRLQAMVADGLTAFQYGPEGVYPFLAHPSFARDPLDWHAWGSRQTQALAQAAAAAAGRVGGGAAEAEAYLRSAEAEAGHFFVHLLVDRGPYSNMNPAVRAYPQIAYGMEAIASGYFALADVTGKAVYDQLGGLMTGWLLGNNALRQSMYDPDTGRVYDGLERGVINRNAGAESTITGIMALVRAESRPTASAMLEYRWLDAHTEFTVEAETGTDFGETPTTEVDGTASGQLAAVLKPGASLAITAEVTDPGRYLVYALYRDDPWEASASVFVGRERLATVATTGAAESRFKLVEIGTLELAAGPLNLTISHAGGRDLHFDALLFRPLVEWKLYGQAGSRLLLLKSWSATGERVPVPDGVSEEAVVAVYDATAGLAGQALADGAVELPPYGFALIEWPDDAPLPQAAQADARVGPLVAVPIAFTADGSVALDLAQLFDADAFSLSSRPQRGNFDNRSGVYGATYPAERAPAASSRFDTGGVAFLFPPTDTEANNVVMLGQRLEVPVGRYSALHLLGASEQGNYQADIRLVYEDGSQDDLTLGLSDWCQLPRYGETVAVEFSQRRGAGGAVERITCRIYLQSLPVDPERALLRVELPDRETMHLFALTLQVAGADRTEETP
ncbi:hypothetical protein [Guyparkeria sp.]|uniref:hypothetical protein n=1 Tax=Guyparkeria sp. TaxID=2035736 RepID=UPI003970F63F